MSTQQTDKGNHQEAPPQTPGSFSQETVPEREVVPPPLFPSPPKRPPRRVNPWFVGSAVAVVLVLILSIVVMLVLPLVRPGGNQPTPTPQPTTPGSDITPTPNPGVVLGPQACPTSVSDPGYWNTIIGTNNGERQVVGIGCANVMDSPSLQSLVLVRHHNASDTLDVYVFNAITSAKPQRIFLLPGLVKGNAGISGYNTLMTAEVDKASTLNAGKPISAMTPDLFREFDWSAEKGTLVQTAFPGIFPDLTRYQAEADQVLVNQGKDTWKNDPKQVAQKLGERFSGMNSPYKATLISGGGAKDVYATVKVEGTPFPSMRTGPAVNVTLSRLEGNTHNMWVVIAVEDGSDLTLTSIEARSLVASPVRLEGKGGAFEGLIGQAYILDHLYTTVGHAVINALPGLGMGVSPYSVLVSYDTSFKQGPQEGVVKVAMTSPVGGPTVMVKVLLDPQPNVALGPMSCPVALQDPGYWESNFGISPATVTCGNLKGPAYISLLALLTVLPYDGKPGRLYVYDLTNARPVQLFSTQTASAMISNASTIITADIDPNSSINKEKSADQVTPDLFREFAWSGKAFVQVAFPGMYPDLTRWQADVDQGLVNRGQDTWKRDAVKTAEHFVAQFLPSPASNPPKLDLVFGGGPQDPQAYVNVSFPTASGLSHPITRLTLSRLALNANGIWEVTAVQADWMAISSPQRGQSTYISSPVTVSGFGPTFEGQVGVVQVLDHLYQRIGWTQAMAPEGSKSPPFTVTFPYTSSFKAGAQEGIVELVHAGGAPFDYGVVMVKVLVNP